MTRRWIALGSVLAAAIATAAHAGGSFAHTDASDELSLARAAERAGDQALAAAMHAGRYDALVAIRASEYARAPELLIPALASHACGRDPTLAPEAAAVLRKLTPRLTPSALAEREALQADLAKARASLHCERAPRADIADALAELATRL